MRRHPEIGDRLNSAKGTKRAIVLINRELRPLKRKHGRNLVLSEREAACLGGAAYVDAQGKQHYGDPSCTVTQPFCVNRQFAP